MRARLFLQACLIAGAAAVLAVLSAGLPFLGCNAREMDTRPIAGARGGPPAAEEQGTESANGTPAEGGRARQDPSPLEAAFSARAGVELRLFGRELFRGLPPTASRTPMARVADDYVLGVGDLLSVVMRGELETDVEHRVDTDGRLVLPRLKPVTVAGRSLGEARQAVATAAQAVSSNLEVVLAVKELRQVGVLVTGAVGRPGRATLTSYATVYDALAAAGGVDANGSLRRVALTRGGRTTTIDLYDLLTTGRGGAGGLIEDGDRIFVPLIGPVAAIAGPVKRPGIFEMAEGQRAFEFATLNELAGGLLRPAAPFVLRLGLGGDGGGTASEINDPAAALIGDGDILILGPRHEDQAGTVRLEGHVFRSGPRALEARRNLSRLVSERDLMPGAYRAFAVHVSFDARTGERRLAAVDLSRVFGGRGDRTLTAGDELVVLGQGDIEFLSSEEVLTVLRGDAGAGPGACPGVRALAQAVAANPNGPLARGPLAMAAAGWVGAEKPCPKVFQTWPDLLPFALRQSVLSAGAGRKPGFLPSATASPDEGAIVDDHVPSVELIGTVRRPGVRPLHAAPSLKGLIGRPGDIADGAYPLIGVIERFERGSLDRRLIPFVPSAVTGDRLDRRLADGDRVHVFAAKAVPDLVGAGADGQGGTDWEEDAPDPAIRALLAEHAVGVGGAVRAPGRYPVGDAVRLEAVIAAAGGIGTHGDPSLVEVTRASGGRTTADLDKRPDRAMPIAPGDDVRVASRPPRIEPGSADISGEVNRPGTYEILRGERLSSLIARAGGLTGDAYPAGAVFSRVAERVRQKSEIESRARGIEERLALAQQRGESISSDQLSHLRQVAALLRGIEPIGRVVVEADPARLRAHPELDSVLEGGDRLVIPRRPLSVMVNGEVLAPGAFPFQAGRSAESYIADAGGATRNADSDRTYVVHPDGRAQPLSLSFWNYSQTFIDPGSVIVVPLDPRPSGFLELTKDIGAILGQLALTAASIAVISR